MDALTRERTVLRTILYERPILSTLLDLSLAAGLVLAWIGRGSEGSDFTVMLIALPACARLAAAAFRIDGCCVAAGALGIPHHLEAVRRVQIALVALWAGLPSIYLLLIGYDVRAVSVLCMASAFGMSLLRPWVLWAALVAWWVGRHFELDLWSFAATPWGVALFVGLALVSFVLWLRMPALAQTRGAWSAAALADARHELSTETPPVHSPKLDALLPSSGRLKPATFWGGLGHLPGSGWKLTAAYVLPWLAVYVLVHFYRHGRADVAAFLAGSLMAGGLSGYRFFTMQGTWATSAGEQSLLLLTPRWPTTGGLRLLVFRSIWEPLPASIVAWASVAVLGWACGWLPLAAVVQGAAAVVAATLALFGFLLLFLAQSRLRKTNRLAMLYLVIILFTGLMMFILRKSPQAWYVCCALLLAASLLPAIAFSLRRPQFPVRPDGDVVL